MNGNYPCAFDPGNSIHDAPGSHCRACGHVHNPLEGYCVKCRVERLEEIVSVGTREAVSDIFRKRP